MEEMKDPYSWLEEIHSRPEPFQFYTAADLWTDEHTSKKMLEYHLNPDIDVSSRRGEFIDRSVEWILSRFGVDGGTRIADFGCGPGLYTTRLARHGARVTGIDFSPRSIEHAREVARKSGLSIDYAVRNYLEYETEGRFDLILMIMCDFCALSPSQRMVMLRKFHSLLAEGGSVLLDVYSLNAFRQREEASSYGVDLFDGFWSAERYYGFLSTFRYEDAKVALDKYTIVEEGGGIRTVYNWMQHFSPQSLRAELEEAGFTKAELYGDVAGASFDEKASEFAVVAGKA